MPEPKFNPKNLSYDSSLPPFLARLHGQHSSAQREGGPDPTLAARRRPGVKKRSASEEAEDAPLVVDERGNVVSSVGFLDGEDGDEGAVVGVGKGEREEGDGTEGLTGPEKKSEQKLEGNGKQEKVAGIGGAAKKRKVGRVVVNDDVEENELDDNDSTGRREKSVDKKKPGATRSKTTSTPTTTATTTTNTAAKPKKKAKKIKLSFGDDEEAG